MHRDLKPENILLEEGEDFDKIKLIDFGESKEFKTGDKQGDLVGTPYYIAPEVMSRSYNEKCDMWSIGVITFILLSGTPPFAGQNEKEIMDTVKTGKYSFKSKAWANVSDNAKDFIEKLLVMDPAKRLSA